MNGFEDSAEDLRWTEDDNGYFRFIDEMKAGGFVPIPDDLPTPPTPEMESEYEFAIYGCLAYWRKRQ